MFKLYVHVHDDDDVSLRAPTAEITIHVIAVLVVGPIGAVQLGTDVWEHLKDNGEVWAKL